jgi:hypothetical protein
MTENGTAPAAPDDDRTPTQESEAPPIKPAEAWVMPEPVFRRSEGYTPQPAEVSDLDLDTPSYIPLTDTQDDIAVDDDPAAQSEFAVQPDTVDEDLETSPVVEPVNQKKKGGFLRILLIVLGIAGAIIVVGGAVIAFVLWYFFQVSESQNLN